MVARTAKVFRVAKDPQFGQGYVFDRGEHVENSLDRYRTGRNIEDLASRMPVKRGFGNQKGEETIERAYWGNPNRQRTIQTTPLTRREMRKLRYHLTKR